MPDNESTFTIKIEDAAASSPAPLPPAPTYAPPPSTYTGPDVHTAFAAANAQLTAQINARTGDLNQQFIDLTRAAQGLTAEFSGLSKAVAAGASPGKTAGGGTAGGELADLLSGLGRAALTLTEQFGALTRGVATAPPATGAPPRLPAAAPAAAPPNAGLVDLAGRAAAEMAVNAQLRVEQELTDKLNAASAQAIQTRNAGLIGLAEQAQAEQHIIDRLKEERDLQEQINAAVAKTNTARNDSLIALAAQAQAETSALGQMKQEAEIAQRLDELKKRQPFDMNAVVNARMRAIEEEEKQRQQRFRIDQEVFRRRPDLAPPALMRPMFQPTAAVMQQGQNLQSLGMLGAMTGMPGGAALGTAGTAMMNPTPLNAAAAGVAALQLAADLTAKAMNTLTNAIRHAGHQTALLVQNDYFGALEDAADQAAQGLGKIPIVGQALESAVDLSLAPLKAFREEINAFVRRGHELAQFSGPLSAAEARAEVMSLRADIREAQTLGPEIARMVEAQARLDNELRSIFLPWKAELAAQLATMLEQMTVIVEELKPLIQIGMGFASGTANSGLMQGLLGVLTQALGPFELLGKEINKNTKKEKDPPDQGLIVQQLWGLIDQKAPEKGFSKDVDRVQKDMLKKFKHAPGFATAGGDF